MKLCAYLFDSRPSDGRAPVCQKICATLCVLFSLSAALATPRVAADAPLDVRLVIDISGSMAEADPDNRRADALSMFIRVLPETAYAGIWTFGAQVNQLVRHDRAGPLWKNIALTRTANLPAHALRSNLPEALQLASWDWEAPPTTGPRHILLLTDGAIDVSDSATINEQATQRLLAELVPRLSQANIRLHVLAMADAPGAELLGQLAAATGGVALDGIKPDQLLSQFVAAIDSVAAASEVPLSNLGATPAFEELVPPSLLGTKLKAEQPTSSTGVALANPEDRVFRLDAGIGSVDLLWLADPGVQLQLIGPDGETFTRSALPPRSRWHVGRGFELVSMASPSPGLWRLMELPGVAPPSAQAPQARMLAYADLQLQLLDSRGALAAQALQSVDAQLTNGQGQAVLDADFLDQIEVFAYLDSAAGTQVVVVEPGREDGQYRATLPALADIEEGVLRFEAVSPTFSRGVRMPFQVRSPVHLELQPQVQGALGWVKVGVDGLSPDTLAIAAKVQRPPAPAKWVPAIKQPGGVWKLMLEEAAGGIELTLDVQGKYLSQKDFSFRSEAVNLTLPLAETQSFKLDETGRQIQAPAPELAVEPDQQEVEPVAQAAPAAHSEQAASPESKPVIEPVQAAVELPQADIPPPQANLPPPQAILPPPQASLPLWFVGLVSLLNLGVCAGLGWLLRPSAASRDLLSKLKAQLSDEPEVEPA